MVGRNLPPLRLSEMDSQLAGPVTRETMREYATELALLYDERRDEALARRVGRRKKDFPNQRLKERELAFCRGAILVLDLLLNALYKSTHGSEIVRRQRKASSERPYSDRDIWDNEL